MLCYFSTMDWHHSNNNHTQNTHNNSCSPNTTRRHSNSITGWHSSEEKNVSGLKEPINYHYIARESVILVDVYRDTIKGTEQKDILKQRIHFMHRSTRAAEHCTNCAVSCCWTCWDIGLFADCCNTVDLAEFFVLVLLFPWMWPYSPIICLIAFQFHSTSNGFHIFCLFDENVLCIEWEWYSLR